MCGLTGYLSLGRYESTNNIIKNISIMSAKLAHRGPDDNGYWVDSNFGIGLGHQRLAIVDLTKAGHQPMESNTGRYVLAFNGEIYNHIDIRTELEKKDICYESKIITNEANINIKWKGNSDTETLLASFEVWGIEETLNKTIGMFAIALWDKKEQKLTLVRDRMGEKPLYYGWVGDNNNLSFVFGSELKSLKAHPNFNNTISRESLSQYIKLAYVPAPLSIYNDIYKLEAGCLIEITIPTASVKPKNAPEQDHPNDGLKIKRWWNLKEKVNQNSIKIINEIDYIDELKKLLKDSIKKQSTTEVPFGAFLSGGVDSSLITAMLQEQLKIPLKTFTIGFDVANYDESPYAKTVSKHIKTEHYEYRVDSKMVEKIIPFLPHIYDEPFADSSQLPTFFVSQLARQKVKVVLSGDAGDELFGGYTKYLDAPKRWNQMKYIPYSARNILGRLIYNINDINNNKFNFSSKFHNFNLDDKFNNISEKLKNVKSFDDLVENMSCVWYDSADLVINNDKSIVFNFQERLKKNYTLDILNQPLGMMLYDSLTYLPDDILCKVDRASMACGLEVRVPFLDHRVVEYSWKLPINMKIRGGISKWSLKELLYQYVPKELVDRPKSGFAIPIGQWLRGPLRDWAENLLNESRLKSENYFHVQPIRKIWSEHISCKRDHTAKLWTVLMFQAWLECETSS